MEFYGQQSDEKILFFGRKHLITLIIRVLEMAFVFLCIMALFVGMFYLIQISLWLSILVAIPVGIFQGLLLYKKYKNTYFVITNRRIVVSLQKGFFRREMHSMKLGPSIESNFKTQGILGSFFQYGELGIDSEAEEKNKHESQLVFWDLYMAQDVKFYLDKIANLLEKGASEESLPVFIFAKKGQRY